MKYKIEKTSSYGYQEKAPCSSAYRGENDQDNYPQWYVDISTLEELQALQDEVNKPLIVSKEHIEIYDAYRE